MLCGLGTETCGILPLIEVLAGVGAAIAAWFSYLAATKSNTTAEQANKTATGALAFQALADLSKDYASRDMADALNMLHKYKRDVDNKQDISQRNLETHFLEKLQHGPDGELTIQLDMARRRVSHFFQRMAIIRETSTVSDESLFLGWSPGNMAIIDTIIVPMELAKAKSINADATETINRLLDLQSACKDSYTRRSRKMSTPR